MAALLIAGVLFFMGWALRRTGVLPDNAAITLNQYVIRVALPALILLRVPELTLRNDLWLPVVSAWAMLWIGWWIGHAVGKWLLLPEAQRYTLALMLALGNTSFIAIPLLTLFFTANSIPIALLYDQLGSFLGLALLGSFLAQRAGSQHVLREKVRSIVFFPPFMALMVAILLGDAPWLKRLHTGIQPVADSLLPVIMVALGAQFTWQIEKTARKIVGIGLAIKMLILPAVLFGVLVVTGVQGIAAQVSVLEAAMPPMMSAAALAATYRLDANLAATLVAFGIVVSFITIPLWVSAVTWFLGG